MVHCTSTSKTVASILAKARPDYARMHHTNTKALPVIAHCKLGTVFVNQALTLTEIDPPVLTGIDPGAC